MLFKPHYRAVAYLEKKGFLNRAHSLEVKWPEVHSFYAVFTWKVYIF